MKSKFECRVEIDTWGEDILVKSTRNGYQYACLCLDDLSQLEQVRDKINEYLASKQVTIAQQAIAGPDDGLKPCPDDCHYRNGRLCVLGPTNHCIRRAEDYYKPGTASAIAGRCVKAGYKI